MRFVFSKDTSEGPTVHKKERLERRLVRIAKKLEKLEEERKKREQENLLLSQQKVQYTHEAN